MIFGKYKPKFSILIVLILFSLAFIIQATSYAQDTGGRAGYGEDKLRITEHRISIVQDEDSDSFTVYDEFWIANRGQEPYFNFVYNSLPEDITIEEGTMIITLMKDGLAEH